MQINNTLVTLDGASFLERKFKPKETIISPFLSTQGLVMIYAARGIGKTYFALTLAGGMLKGESLFDGRFIISKKWRVLYIDGEMSAFDMQDRIKSLKLDPESLERLTIINPDAQESNTVPNLASEEGQQILQDIINAHDVIIVDNISTLARQVSENQANSWDMVQEWALKCRSLGKSVIFIHHAGKNNAQRGTSRREDVLDTVINLRRPKDYSPREGARFEIHFEKTRNFSGEDAEPFELKLINNSWESSEIDEDGKNIEQKILNLSKMGHSQREISSLVKTSPSKVNRIIMKFKETQ